MSASQTVLQERPTSEPKRGHLQDAEANLAAGAGAPSVADQVLAKLDSIFEPNDGLQWLGTPHPDLGGSPIELIETGHADRVLRMLLRLEEGVHT